MALFVLGQSSPRVTDHRDRARPEQPRGHLLVRRFLRPTCALSPRRRSALFRSRVVSALESTVGYADCGFY